MSEIGSISFRGKGTIHVGTRTLQLTTPTKKTEEREDVIKKVSLTRGVYLGPEIPGHPGRWRILSLLGRGGMASVYEAEDLALNKKRVAIKVAPASSAEAVARFKREVKTLASLEHPAIVRIVDAGEQIVDGEHVTYMVMEKLVGKTIEDFLVEDPSWASSLSVEWICGIMGQYAHVLAAAHVAGIVHRDIKPSNLFLARNPDGTTAPKMIDFGIARRLLAEASRETKRLTEEGAIMGTPYYMAPEQLQSEDVGSPADQFALATVMFELLTGMVVYNPPSDTDKTITQTILFRVMAMQKGPDSWIERLPESVPVGLREVLRRALQLDPAKRFPSTFEMCRELYRLAGLPEPEAPVPPPDPGEATEILETPVSAGAVDLSKETLSPVVTGKKGVAQQATLARGIPTLTVGLGVMGVAALIVGVGALVSWPSTPVPSAPHNGVRVSVLDVPPSPPSLPRPPPPRVEDSGVAPLVLVVEDAGDAPEDAGIETANVAETDAGSTPPPSRGRPHRPRARPTPQELRERAALRDLELQCCNGFGVRVSGVASCPPSPDSADYSRLRCGHH